MTAAKMLALPSLGRVGGCRGGLDSSRAAPCLRLGGSGSRCLVGHEARFVSCGRIGREGLVFPRNSGLRSRKTSARRLIEIAATSRDGYNVPPQEPSTLWLWIFSSAYGALKYGLVFLWEQPGQLQYIEWPSLQSTIKMTMLTVVVVAFLIIFLATVDSTFSFVLSSILRRVA